MAASSAPDRLTCTIGVMAYNEERNIGRLLGALRAQETTCCEVTEIIVVASGCTDGTESLTREAAGIDPRVRLIAQARREGKARAINVFLQAARAGGADVCILQSGDTLPERGTIDALIRPMVVDRGVGMTGAHVVPVNGGRTLVGAAVQTLWRLHHRLALEVPKMGELVAFRNVVETIPEDSAVDEVSIEAAVTSQGLGLKYVPEAVVLNKGPETVADFLRQRRRIHAGHLQVARHTAYAPSTMSLGRVAKHFMAEMMAHPARIPAGLCAAALEAAGRTLGAYDVYVLRRSHAIWEIAVTTKNVQGH